MKGRVMLSEANKEYLKNWKQVLNKQRTER